jgi:hypothetical protein
MRQCSADARAVTVWPGAVAWVERKTPVNGQTATIWCRARRTTALDHAPAHGADGPVPLPVLLLPVVLPPSPPPMRAAAVRARPRAVDVKGRAALPCCSAGRRCPALSGTCVPTYPNRRGSMPGCAITFLAPCSRSDRPCVRSCCSSSSPLRVEPASRPARARGCADHDSRERRCVRHLTEVPSSRARDGHGLRDALRRTNDAPSRPGRAGPRPRQAGTPPLLSVAVPPVRAPRRVCTEGADGVPCPALLRRYPFPLRTQT